MKDNVTYGEKYKPAMEITDQGEADTYFDRCVEHNMRTADRDRAKAEEIERHNLGYFSGYYGTEVQRRVERLYKTQHPLFGKVDGGSGWTPEEEARKTMGKEV